MFIWIIAVSVSLVQANTQDIGISCTAIAEDGDPQGHQVMEQALITLKHEYRSNTNGQPYSDTRFTDSHKLGISDRWEETIKDNEENDHHLSITFNGTHVCTAIEYLGVGEACADIGCHENEPVRECRRSCFIASDNQATHVLDFYKSVKTSTGIGTWTTQDYLELRIVEDVVSRCYQLDDYYDKKFPVAVPNVTCPIGQMCRVSLAYVQETSNPRYYIGCEEKIGHIDGCLSQGCAYNVREKIDGSSTFYTWHRLCRYCCYGDLCNDVNKCSEYSCDLSRDSDKDMGSGAITHFTTVFSVILIISLNVLVQ